MRDVERAQQDEGTHLIRLHLIGRMPVIRLRPNAVGFSSPKELPVRLPALAIAAALAAGVLLFIPTASQAASPAYYVDCSVQGGGSGSAGRPWNSIAAVNGHGAFAPGDQILFKRGTTCNGMLDPRGNGAAGHPIVIGAYGSGAKPTIAGGGTGTWEGGILLQDLQHWTVQDLHVTNTDGGATTPFYRSGVMIRNTTGGQLNGITVQRLNVDHVVSSMSDDGNGSRSFGGISAITMPGLTGGFTDLLIADNTVDHVGRTGIITTNISWGAGQDVRPRVTGNRVNHTRGDGIVMLGATKGRIDHNVSSYANDEWPCPDCGGVSPRTANAAIWTGLSQSVLIDHNEAYGTEVPGGDGEGLDIDISAVDTVVEYNYSHDNDGGGILICGSTNATIRFNVFEDNRLGTFTFIGSIPANSTRIHNNTVSISKKANGQVVRSFGGTGGKDIRFFNNLVYNHGGGYYQWPTTSVTASHNTFVGSHGLGEPTGPRTSRRDPGLRNEGSGGIGFTSLSGYRPRSAKNDPAGVAISGAKTDFFGKKFDLKRPPRGAAG